MKKLSVNSVVWVVVTIMLTAGMAQAATIGVIQPIAGKESSDVFGRVAALAINGTGLSDSTIVQTGDPVPDPWPGHGTTEATSWTSANATIANQWIMFDLGGEYRIGDLHVWNYNEIAGRGIKLVDIYFTTNGAGYSAGNPADTSWGTAITEITQFLIAPQAVGYQGDTYSLTTPITARYVLFDVKSRHASATTEFVGLAEVRFVAIPEPASFLLLMLGGFGLMFRRPRR